jgi:hypothetical protein
LLARGQDFMSRAGLWATDPPKLYLSVDIEAVDSRLPGGGLALGATAAARTKGKILWCITRQDLFAPADGGVAPRQRPRAASA